MNKKGFSPLEPTNPSRQLSKGEQPYTMSCLEYVAIILNNWFASMDKIEGVDVLFHAISKDDTISIRISYNAEMPLDPIDDIIGIAQNMVLEVITPEGWDSWVKIIVERIIH